MIDFVENGLTTELGFLAKDVSVGFVNETDDMGVVPVEENEYLDSTNVEQSETNEQFRVGVGNAGAGSRTAAFNGETFNLRLAIPGTFSEQGMGKLVASAFSFGVGKGTEKLDENTFA